MNTHKSCVVLLSGGMDSTTLLYAVRSLWPEGRHAAISFDYGQRHGKELMAARDIAFRLNVEHRVADLTQVGNEFMFGSSQTSPEIAVPHGHYAAESMKQTVVPNRNMVMLAIATSWAVASKRHLVAYAAHAGDHAIYPDCRPEFIEAMAEAITLADWHQVQLYAPFQHWSKTDIVAEGQRLGVPFEDTWTCYEGDAVPCQKCGTCVERAEAFEQNGLQDPLLREVNR